jgi:Thaumatin family./Ricin-type beta-trefoil lectin domain.
MPPHVRSLPIRWARVSGYVAVALVLVLAAGLIVVMSTRSVAVGGERVTFVNATAETLWIGAGENPDGSRRIGGLPTLRPGESATVVVPYGDGPGHWRGRFFARQRCSGSPGSTFHCLVGDCGVYPDRCERTAEPVSLAEFNFDQNDPLGPWYNVSYVDALSLAITIETPGAPGSAVAGSCVRWDCSGGQLLAACPEELAVKDPQRGDRVNCVNPNRDAESAYTAALRPFGPRAYLWSAHDLVPGAETVFNCAGCSDFVVTFHNSGVTSPAAGDTAAADSPVFALRGYADKCIDVPGGISADGAQLQLWDCNGTPAQRFSHGPNGSLVVLDKCMDVAWASRDDGARVQLAYCNGGPAQVWVSEGGMLRNPHSGKCVDVRDWNAANGAPLQLWTCAPGQANQVWRAVRH